MQPEEEGLLAPGQVPDRALNLDRAVCPRNSAFRGRPVTFAAGLTLAFGLSLPSPVHSSMVIVGYRARRQQDGTGRTPCF